MMITAIHKTGDYQSDSFEVGKGGVTSIEEFTVNGEYCELKRLRVTIDNGITVDLNYQPLTIYRREL